VIALLRGEVAVRRSDHVVILCGDVGYRAAVSAETLRHVPAVGGQATLHTHLIVRDDALALYGFASESERDLFLMLLSVQAVGPKVALAVLSVGPPRELLAALAAGDAGRFQAVPGIGKRTAERIIVELREKVAGLGVPELAANGAAGGAGGPITARRVDSPRTLARDGLLELGFTLGEAEELLRDADGPSAEALITQALGRAHGCAGSHGRSGSPARSAPAGLIPADPVAGDR
jgi:holliday junction DNA helicase RuvA